MTHEAHCSNLDGQSAIAKYLLCTAILQGTRVLLACHLLSPDKAAEHLCAQSVLHSSLPSSAIASASCSLFPRASLLHAGNQVQV